MYTIYRFFFLNKTKENKLINKFPELITRCSNNKSVFYMHMSIAMT